MNLKSLPIALLALLLSTSVWAEDQAKHDLQKAFFKEYSFLLKEKKAMEARLQSLKQTMKKEKSAENKDLENLKAQNDALRLQADRINDNIATLERETLAKESNQTVFEATLEQASATLNEGHADPLKTIEATVMRSLAVLDKNGRVTIEKDSRFYLENGSEVSGDVLHFGAIARFGRSDDVMGPLAPTGGGAFKLWQTAANPSAVESLFAGQTPASVQLFLYESETKEVKHSEEKDALTIINSGGLIAWVIVILGAIAVFFALIRGAFLMSLGRNGRNNIDYISECVQQGNLDAAKERSNKIGGSLKRVINATLNNLHRDREHVEDTISEAILHEHTHLDRFHSLIMVIAAISPLLGLLGTVTGMIETFDIITEFGTGDPKLLSGGISIALVTTELGLIVAIPVLVIGTLLASWGNKIKDDIERSALHIVNQYQNKMSA